MSSSCLPPWQIASPAKALESPLIKFINGLSRVEIPQQRLISTLIAEQIAFFDPAPPPPLSLILVVSARFTTLLPTHRLAVLIVDYTVNTSYLLDYSSEDS